MELSSPVPATAVPVAFAGASSLCISAVPTVIARVPFRIPVIAYLTLSSVPCTFATVPVLPLYLGLSPTYFTLAPFLNKEPFTSSFNFLICASAFLTLSILLSANLDICLMPALARRCLESLSNFLTMFLTNCSASFVNTFDGLFHVFLRF